MSPRTRASLHALFKDTLVVLDTLRVRLELDPPSGGGIPVVLGRFQRGTREGGPPCSRMMATCSLPRAPSRAMMATMWELFLKHLRWPKKEAIGPCHLKFLGPRNDRPFRKCGVVNGPGA